MIVHLGRERLINDRICVAAAPLRANSHRVESAVPPLLFRCAPGTRRLALCERQLVRMDQTQATCCSDIRNHGLVVEGVSAVTRKGGIPPGRPCRPLYAGWP